MHKVRMIGATIGALTLAVGTAVALAAPAAATTPDCKTVTTTLKNRPESPRWADGTFARKVTICQTAPGKYHATVEDLGTFVTVADAKSPGGGVDKLAGGIAGKLKGGFTADFQAAANFATFDPSKLDGKELTGVPEGAPTTPGWVKSMFSDFEGTSLNDDWKWTYTTCAEEWINATEALGGNKGDITGKPCPTPTPTPTPTPAATAPAGGGAGTGGGTGGLPVTGASLGIFVAIAAALLTAGGGLYLVARRRRVTFTS